MLGKLLKYEWKSTRRIFPLIYAAVLIIAFLLGLSMRGVGTSNAVFGNELGSVMFMGVYLILILALAVVTIVVIIARFYKNMVSQEGYLTHVLPVRTWQHVASKTIMAFIWFFLAVVVILVSIFVMAAATGELRIVWQEIRLSELMEMIRDVKGTVILFVICFFVQIVRLILQFYASMSIGGAANKHKVLYSFLAFIVIAVILNVVNTLLSLGAVNGIVDLALSGTGDLMVTSLLVKQLVSDLVVGAVFFVLTNYFLKNRLNLE